MAYVGQILKNPAGGRMLFRKTAATTQGALLEMEVSYPPMSNAPSAHYHPEQEECFEIISGSMQVQLGDTVQTYHAGEQFIVPTGVSHSMHNPENEEAIVIWQVRPALKTETMFETLWGLAADGKTNSKGMPPLLQAAVIGQAYNHEMRQSKPPYSVMRIVLALLSIVGYLAGYRASYESYSPAKPDVR